MEWIRVLELLRSSGDEGSLRLADLLEMDLAGLTNTGPEGIAYGSGYGDNIPRAFQDRFRSVIDTCAKTCGTSYKPEFRNILSDPFLASSRPVPLPLLDSANDANRIGAATSAWGAGVYAVRYVNLFSFLKNMLAATVDDLPLPGDPTRADEARKQLTEGLRRLGHPRRPKVSLGSPFDGRVWVTRNSEPPPHEEPGVRSLSDPDRCSFVVRKMGLPGFDREEDRAAKIGLVALVYLLPDSRPLYRPTVMDALNQPLPLFYPAPKGAQNGETLPLVSDLSRSGPRSESGVREWVHQNFEALPVELRGSMAYETFAMTWYGTW